LLTIFLLYWTFQKKVLHFPVFIADNFCGFRKICFFNQELEEKMRFLAIALFALFFAVSCGSAEKKAEEAPAQAEAPAAEAQAEAPAEEAAPAAEAQAEEAPAAEAPAEEAPAEEAAE